LQPKAVSLFVGRELSVRTKPGGLVFPPQINAGGAKLKTPGTDHLDLALEAPRCKAVAKLQKRGLGAVPAVRESKRDLRMETRPALDIFAASAGVDTGALLHLGKEKGKGGGGGNQLDKGEKERKGIFF
jgi:hypothetical protein